MTPDLYSFIEANGTGYSKTTILEAIICLSDGTEVLAKHWRKNNPHT
jgi:recombinational DNA repair ATPase RecF